MPWKDKTVEELRKEFIEAARSCSNFSSLCREFGITRATGYKWIRRYENNETLSDRSRRPNITANKTSEAIETKIIETRAVHPGWGAKKIKVSLENKGIEMPCIKTVNNILNRYGCISKEESLKHKAFTRFEKNDVMKCGKQTSRESSKCKTETIVFRWIYLMIIAGSLFG